MISAGIKNIVEALLFASDEELSLKDIKDILDSFKINVKITEIENSITELNNDYNNSSSAFEIIKLAGGFQFATRKKYAHFVGKLSAEIQRKKLSQSAVETLAIIAYKQPITRSEIEFIRGVNVDYIVNSLLERDLITIKGRANGPGRPILYGTTTSFLRVLGLNSLDDLPKLREINDILKNEKIEGITEADIDLFNSMSSQAQAEVEAGVKRNGADGTVQIPFDTTVNSVSSGKNPDESIDEFKTENDNISPDVIDKIQNTANGENDININEEDSENFKKREDGNQT
ncbi:MAG: SMC-Scp complex subunit ScpB [Ignavibacteriae bacterium]|nr:SMC-Scp complex subunit ScpB [Ignavibacteriota bacterium]